MTEMYAVDVPPNIINKVTDALRKTPHALFGRTECNQPVVFNGPDRLIGQLVDIRITEAPMRSLRGEVVTASSASLGVSRWAEAA